MKETFDVILKLLLGAGMLFYALNRNSIKEAAEEASNRRALLEARRIEQSMGLSTKRKYNAALQQDVEINKVELSVPARRPGPWLDKEAQEAASNRRDFFEARRIGQSSGPSPSTIRKHLAALQQDVETNKVEISIPARRPGPWLGND
jgi:hypothetical protein